MRPITSSMEEFRFKCNETQDGLYVNTVKENVPLPPWCVCGGMGYFHLNREPGQPFFGDVFYCLCMEDEMAKRKGERLRQKSGLRGKLLELTFSNFDVRHAGREHIKDLTSKKEDCVGFAKEPGKRWLTIFGPFGCGKTHLAAAIANHCLINGSPVHFATVPDLLDHIRSGYDDGSYEEIINDLSTVGLLVLDDFGVNKSTDWVEEKLFQVVNARDVDNLPMVFTSNLSPGMIGGRIGSRMTEGLGVEGSIVLHLDVGDQRPNAKRRVV